jgi:acyl carrier protein
MMAREQLRARIASVLGFTPERLNTVAPLTELGVDSLLAVRIRNAVHHDFDVSLPVSLLLRGASVIDTEHWLCSELGMVPELDTTPAVPRPQAPVLIGPRDGQGRLVTQAWAEALRGELGVTQDFYALGGDHEKAELITGSWSNGAAGSSASRSCSSIRPSNGWPGTCENTAKTVRRSRCCGSKEPGRPFSSSIRRVATRPSIGRLAS